MEHRSLRRHTRLQETIFLEKCYEEKFGKKLRKRKQKQDSSRDSYQPCRKGDASKRDIDSKRTRASEGSDEPEEVIICLGDEPRRGSLCPPENKGLEEKWNFGNDCDTVFLVEEVVSNHNSSRVPSSLGSGMNSGCSLESPEVVSSCLRRERECILLSEDSSESEGPEKEVDKCSEVNLCTAALVEEDGSVTPIMGEEEEENKDDYDDARVEGGIYVSKKGESNVVEELNDYFQFCDDGNDGECNRTLIEGKHKGKKQKQVIEDGLIRQKVYGMDVLSTCNKKGYNVDNGIARRLRSRKLSKSKRKILKLGTVSRPLVIDEKLESSSDSEDKLPPAVSYKSDSFSDSEDTIDCSADSEDKIDCSTDSEDTLESSPEEDMNIVCKNKVKSDRMGIRMQKKRLEKQKNKKKSTSNSPDFEKFFSAIWQEASCIQEKKHSKLPLKFTFEDQNPVVQEKEEWEKENESLFDEMELGLKAIEIGSSGPSMDDSSEPEASAVELCRKGKHNLKLEEDIGMICRNCSYVLEMKYIFPEFAKDPFRRREKKSLSVDAETDCSFVDRLKLPNYYSKSNSSSVNVEGTVWDLVPGMKEKMYPHQHEGFEFIWGHFSGGISLEKLSLKESLSDERNGCIINHAPGTGKTCLVIVFLLSFMRLHPKCRPFIVAPCSMLRNWELEFQKWNVNIPFYNLNNKLSQKEYDKATKQFGHVGLDINWSRMLKLCFWRQEPSVLAISYQLFVKLAGEQGEPEIAEKNYKAKNLLIRRILLGLSDDILVLDEGHTARNENTKIVKALSEVKTKRRIILSGTPFQNNTTELRNTLRLVNPKFADQMNFRKRDRQARELAEQEFLSLTTSVVWKGGDVAKLKEMNYPFVHVYEGGILLELPGLKDSRIDLRPTALQAKLLNIAKKVSEYLRRRSLMTWISIHPSLVSDCPEFSEDDRGEVKKLASNPDGGVKTKFVLELIRLCGVLHERVLIFCTYLNPLKLIMNQLKSQFDWVEEREVLQMDGSADQEKRKTIIKKMNDPDSDVRVLLASTKACNEGINLVGASRVVILDVAFNPSVEKQAISRAYRIGQKKAVYVYHLIASESLEVDDYLNQNLKEDISKLVFSSNDKHICSNGETVNPKAAVLQDKVLELMVQHENLQNMFEQIYERPRTD